MYIHRRVQIETKQRVLRKRTIFSPAGAIAHTNPPIMLIDEYVHDSSPGREEEADEVGTGLTHRLPCIPGPT